MTWGSGPTSFFHVWISSCSSTICWRDYPFPLNGWGTLLKNQFTIWIDFWAFTSLPWTICLSLCHYHSFDDLVALPGVIELLECYKFMYNETLKVFSYNFFKYSFLAFSSLFWYSRIYMLVCLKVFHRSLRLCSFFLLSFSFCYSDGIILIMFDFHWFFCLVVSDVELLWGFHFRYCAFEV